MPILTLWVRRALRTRKARFLLLPKGEKNHLGLWMRLLSVVPACAVSSESAQRDEMRSRYHRPRPFPEPPQAGTACSAPPHLLLSHTYANTVHIHSHACFPTHICTCSVLTCMVLPFHTFLSCVPWFVCVTLTCDTPSSHLHTCLCIPTNLPTLCQLVASLRLPVGTLAPECRLTLP